MTDAFAALVDVAAQGRWGGSALVLGTVLPHAGLPVRAATRQGLAPRQGARVPAARVDHAARNAARSAVLCQLRLHWRIEPTDDGACVLLDARYSLNGAATAASPALVRAHPRPLCANARCARVARRRKPKKREAVCRFRRSGSILERKRRALPSCAAAQRRDLGRSVCARHPIEYTQVASLQEFFKDSVAAAMAKQGVAADDHTAYYVVNLLTLFARQETLYERGKPGPGLQPLALLLAAAAADCPRPRDAQRDAAPGRRHVAVRRRLLGRRVRTQARRRRLLHRHGRRSLRLPVTTTCAARAKGARSAPCSPSSPRSSAISSTCSPRFATRERPRAIDVLRLYELWLRDAQPARGAPAARARPRAERHAERGDASLDRCCSRKLETMLHELYALEVGYAVNDFLITDAALARALDAGGRRSTRSS